MKIISFLVALLNILITIFAYDQKHLKIKDSSDVVVLKDALDFNIKCFLFNDYNVYDLRGLGRDFRAKE